jgi:hypothetical protein
MPGGTKAAAGASGKLGFGICVVAFLGLSIVTAVVGNPARSHATGAPCPDASAIERPPYPRGAVPAAKAALGGPGRVTEVRRGPGSTYAASAKRVCGATVLRDSVYVVVHPVGQTCAACDLHSYVVRFKSGGWKVWIAY